ncbi:DUF2075 domain-containing protein [Fructobacillus ficulneus]|nr:DUF2075 domain-containing protein [Fructobacillus ficulneus]
MDKKQTDNLAPFDLSDLSENQEQTLRNLETYIQNSLLDKSSQKHIAVIQGAAGTGKSVVLTQLFKTLKSGEKKPLTPYYGLKTVMTVNHPELLKVYQEMGAKYPYIFKKDYLRPTSLINRVHQGSQAPDVVLIDEGHLLLSKREPYIRFFQDNQLAEIIKLAKVVVVVFDFQQVIQSKMYWNQTLLNQVLSSYDYRYFPLDFQYRMQVNQDVANWIDQFSRGILKPFPSNLENYDLRIFNRAADLFKEIKNRDHSVGQSRVVGTTGFPRRADGAHHVVVDDFDLPWDEFDSQVATWPNRPESINEVGSIYTVQGFDMNYVGLLLSPAFEYDSVSDQITVNDQKVTHREIYKSSPTLSEPGQIKQAKTDFMLNALNILAKRGRYGLYIKAADEKLNQRLLELANK